MEATSFNHLETLDTSGTTTYSDWFRSGSALEIYAYVDSTEAGTPNSESVAVTLERYRPYRTRSDANVGTFTAITGDVAEEKHYYATATKFGTRMRFKFVTSGTWSADSVKVYCTVFMRNR